MLGELMRAATSVIDNDDSIFRYWRRNHIRVIRVEIEDDGG